jgi:hypothetical protein
MPNRRCLLTLGATILASLAAGQTGWADENPILIVRVRDQAQLPDRTLREALMIAGGVYRRAGVTVEWRLQPGDAVDEGGLAIAIVGAVAEPRFRASDDSMGVARGEDGARAIVAYVFYDRVREFGQRSRVDAWIVLGCAIAHELGHLLLPVNSHAPDGIMRANWDPKMLSRAGGFLSFAPDQGRLLRLRVASREP